MTTAEAVAAVAAVGPDLDLGDVAGHDPGPVVQGPGASLGAGKIGPGPDPSPEERGRGPGQSPSRGAGPSPGPTPEANPNPSPGAGLGPGPMTGRGEALDDLMIRRRGGDG